MSRLPDAVSGKDPTIISISADVAISLVVTLCETSLTLSDTVEGEITIEFDVLREIEDSAPV